MYRKGEISCVRSGGKTFPSWFGAQKPLPIWNSSGATGAFSSWASQGVENLPRRRPGCRGGQESHCVYFSTLTDLIKSLAKVEREDTLRERLRFQAPSGARQPMSPAGLSDLDASGADKGTWSPTSPIPNYCRGLSQFACGLQHNLYGTRQYKLSPVSAFCQFLSRSHMFGGS